jgi:hypothetical protein
MDTTQSPQTLADLGNALGSHTQTYKALVGENLGNITLKLSLSLRQFTDMSWVANKANNSQNEQFKDEAVAQRSLIPSHVKGLAQYTLMGLVNAQFRELKRSGVSISPQVQKLITFLPSGPYASLQPIVCNIRSCDFGGGGIAIKSIKDKYDHDTGVYDVSLGQKDLLYVVDGQHRRAGFDLVMIFLKDVIRTYKYPKKGIFMPPNYDDDLISESEHDFWQKVLELALTKSTVGVEVHLGLDADQEQQMFVDLNAKSKNVQTSFVNSFDHADPINKYINEVLIGETVVSFGLSDEDQSDWNNDSGDLKRKDVKQICSLLILGKTSSSDATPVIIEERSTFGKTFWSAISKVPEFSHPGAKTKTILQQPIVLKALAKLSYDLGYGTPKLRNTDNLKSLFQAISDGTLNFSHENKIWRSLMLTASEREENYEGISKYIFVPSGTNLDAGTWDAENNWVRYGSRHNDIYPRLGDIVRYTLDFSPRPTVTKAIDSETLANDLEAAGVDLSKVANG